MEKSNAGKALYDLLAVFAEIDISQR